MKKNFLYAREIIEFLSFGTILVKVSLQKVCWICWLICCLKNLSLKRQMIRRRNKV